MAVSTPTTTPELIDDMADGDNLIIAQLCRNGLWITYNDGSGTTQYPAALTTFMMSSPGCCGSNYAARTYGTLDALSLDYADMEIWILNPTAPYDASAYNGISFWAKIGSSSANLFSVQVPEAATVPVTSGGACTGICWDNFQVPVTFTTSWTQYTLSFSQLTQLGWGTSASFTAAQIVGIEWIINHQPGATYDLWVGNVSFYP